MTQRTRTWLKENFQNRDPQDFHDDMIDTFGISIARQTGSVFYTDPDNGSDTANDGQSPESAFETLQAGIDAATDGAGDMVVRMPGNENPTAAINVNKDGIIIVASNFGADPRQGSESEHATWPDAAYTTGPMVIVSRPCAIIGLEYVTRNVASGFNDDGTDSGAALVFIGNAGAEAGFGCLIDSCKFVDWWGNDWGIEFAAGAYNVINNCVFEGFAAGIMTRGTALRNPTHNGVYWCEFVDCVNGIEHRPGTTQNLRYGHNTFIDYTDAFDSGGNGGDGLIFDNWYETATDAATYDLTVAQLQALGYNLSGNHYSE